ncbi:DUF4331 domain-containing protein [Cryptosporangium arvum]|uniref:DUF4331 domain-containing protein n=1 Tax=Cryptosporangium arvum TaxID=80871 RepID=UPI0004B60F35|nr:DUF4331 domain-containing protein [Cryptosporangium arvum]
MIRTLAALGLALTVLTPGAASASSHREAPGIAGLPQYDNTDLYAFVSPDRPDRVTLIANWIPFEEPAGGPTFYPFATDARYEITIDNNGDAHRDVTYRWQFTSKYADEDTSGYTTGPVTGLDDPDLNFWQTYRLEEIRWAADGSRTGVDVLAEALPVAPSNVGEASMPDYRTLRDRVVRSQHGVTMFAGQAEDPFFADLRVFQGSSGGDDTLAPYNVNSVALQVPVSRVTRGGDPVIGIWSTASRREASGEYVQVSRLGMPLVNEVFVPLRDRDRFNASSPSGDARSPVAVPREFLTGVAGLNRPARVSPSEQLRLNTSILPTTSPKRLGVVAGDRAGFPNGRRLTDDVVDITRRMTGDAGDGVDANDVPFEGAFPYLALPKSSGVGSRGPESSGRVDRGGVDPSVPVPVSVGDEARDASGAGMSDLLPLGSAVGGAGLLAFGAAWFWRRRRMS